MFFSGASCECPGSFIRMDSKEVISLAEQTIAWIKKDREKQLTNLIKKERAEMVRGFWFKFFKKQTPSDQEVIKYYESKCSPFSEIMFIDMSYGTSEKVANRLINAAKHADEVYVSAEDLERIS